MNIIEVIPIAKLPSQAPQLLSYFFNQPLAKGAIVEILINNRRVQAVVISSYSVEEQKILLKKSGFQLKKILSVITEKPALTEIQLKLALWLSKNYFVPPGLALRTVLPTFFGDSKFPFKYPAVVADKEIALRPRILLTSAKKIIENIKSEIKKVIGYKKQVLIIVPEISIAKYFYDIIAGYYETAFLAGSLTLKKSHSHWQKIASGEAEVIIGTRQALFAPFSNLGLIIVEDPSSETYKSDMSPKYNTCDLAHQIAKLYSVDILLISRIPSIRDYNRVKNKILALEETGRPVQADTKIEDMIQEMRSGNFSIFSRESKNNLAQYAKKNKKILIFSTRKGYSGSLICENCSFIIKCSQCTVPLKIYKHPLPFLLCSRCSLAQKIPEACPNCQSYKLKTAGYAGSEKIKTEIESFLESVGCKKDIYIFDLSYVKNLKAESEIVKKIEDSESFICIATQAVFSYRFNLNFDLVIIPNLDSLTVLPDFKAEERTFLQFNKLFDFEPEKIIIQTYNADNQLLSYLAGGNYKEFYNKELELRKMFLYPPFSRLIKLSFFSSDSNKASYEARILSEKLKMAIVQRKLDDKVRILGPSPAFVEKEKGLYIHNIILKISPSMKPSEILKFVPSNWNIDIDPRSIL